LAYAGLYFFWGTTYLAIRIAVKGLPPFFLSGLRHGVAGLCFLAYARWKGAAWPSRRQCLGALAMGVTFLAAGNGLCTWALQWVESGYATLLMAGVPMIALTYGAWIHGQKVRGQEWALVLLGLAGVIVLLSPKTSAAHSSSPLALAVLCFGTLSWACTMAEKKRVPQPQNVIMSTAFQMLGGGLFLLLVSAPWERPWALDFAAVPGSAWVAWVYLLAFGSCVGYGSFSWLMTVDPPELVGTYAYVNPIVAVLAGHWILGEALSVGILVSGALVLASVAGLLRLERDDAKLARSAR
jgi:drug/metabolite transporter (DMT)-like permease